MDTLGKWIDILLYFFRQECSVKMLDQEARIAI